MLSLSVGAATTLERLCGLKVHLSPAIYTGFDIRKPVFGDVNNKSADQPAHMCSLISAFVIWLFESIVYILAKGKISTVLLVSVGEQTGLNLTFSETQKTGFFGCTLKPV